MRNFPEYARSSYFPHLSVCINSVFETESIPSTVSRNSCPAYVRSFTFNSDFATEEGLNEDAAEEFEKFNTTFLSEMLDEEIHFYLCGLKDGLKMFAMTEEADYEDLPKYGILHQTVERTE